MLSKRNTFGDQFLFTIENHKHLTDLWRTKLFDESADINKLMKSDNWPFSRCADCCNRISSVGLRRVVNNAAAVIMFCDHQSNCQ